MTKQMFFYFFSLVALFSSGMVIVGKNAVKSVLFLIITFFSSACLWMLLEVEFLSIALVLVYVGAVMVLFLFVVMMLDLDMSAKQANFTKYLPVGICIPLLLLIVLIYIFSPDNFFLINNNTYISQQAVVSNTHKLGMALYADYLFHFEIAGILLLVAIISVISLSYRETKMSKKQQISDQIKAKKNDRIKLVDLNSKGTSYDD